MRTELPVRIAHRIRDLQTLPYVVVKQEWVAKVYEVSSMMGDESWTKSFKSSSTGARLKSADVYILTGWHLTYWYLKVSEVSRDPYSRG